jgi:hypothetical protein
VSVELKLSYLGQRVNQLSIEIHGLSFKAVEKLSHLTRAISVIQLLRQRIDEGITIVQWQIQLV